MKIKQLITLENYKFGYKIMNKEIPNRLQYVLNYDKNNHSLNKKNVLNIPKHNISTYGKSFLFSSIRENVFLTYHLAMDYLSLQNVTTMKDGLWTHHKHSGVSAAKLLTPT